jgi:hypothetical protein
VCKPSAVTVDWVKKGCHIHVHGVELTVAPDHQGGVIFRPYFSTTPVAQATRALKTAREDCLSNPAWRERWIRDIEHARDDYMPGVEGAHKSWANGRMLEFTFLILALKRYEA